MPNDGAHALANKLNELRSTFNPQLVDWWTASKGFDRLSPWNKLKRLKQYAEKEWEARRRNSQPTGTLDRFQTPPAGKSTHYKWRG